MKKRFLLLLVAFLLVFTGCGYGDYIDRSFSYGNTLIDLGIFGDEESDSTFKRVRVSNIVDGDTIDIVDGNGDKHRVRFILVDTPETKHPKKGVEFYGQEASDFTEEMLLDKDVYLEKDVSETDRYGRILAYVWLERPENSEPTDQELYDLCFNSILLENGYGQVATYPPDIKYLDQFLTRQDIARENNYGLWNEDLENLWLDEKGSKDEKDENKSATGIDEEALGQADYIGNSNTGLFHHPSCRAVKQMKDSNKVGLKSRDQAIEEGYVPCSICNP